MKFNEPVSPSGIAALLLHRQWPGNRSRWCALDAGRDSYPGGRAGILVVGDLRILIGASVGVTSRAWANKLTE